MINDSFNYFQNNSSRFYSISTNIASITFTTVTSVYFTQVAPVWPAALFMNTMLLTGTVVGHLLGVWLEDYRNNRELIFAVKVCQYAFSALVAQQVCKVFKVVFTFYQIVQLFVGFVVTLRLVKTFFKGSNSSP